MSTQAATTAAKAAASSPQGSAAASAVQTYLVQPVVRALQRAEAASAAKLAVATKANAKLAAAIAEAEAAGTDAAAASTRRYLAEQRALLPYRATRIFAEGRHLLGGAYFKDYTVRRAVVDARYLTQALLIFLIAVICGRTTVYPPIAPDSPFALGLEHKVNPNF